MQSVTAYKRQAGQDLPTGLLQLLSTLPAVTCGCWLHQVRERGDSVRSVCTHFYGVKIRSMYISGSLQTSTRGQGLAEGSGALCCTVALSLPLPIGSFGLVKFLHREPCQQSLG